MFDVSTTEITREIAWVSILMYSIALIYTLATYRKWTTTSNGWFRNLFWLLFFCVFAITYAIDSDFFHYKEMVSETREVLEYGLERVYQYIILSTNNNYFLFRLIVFGGSVFVYYLVLGRFKINKMQGLLLMVVVFGGVFSYARATLAFSVYYLGLSFLLELNSKDTINKHLFFYRILGVLLGCGLIISSYYFHRSMILLIAFTPFAFLKLGKRGVWAMTILSPILLFVALSLLGNVFSILFYDEVIEHRITDTYAEAIDAEANWRGVISNILSYGRFVLCFIFVSMSIFKNGITMRREIKQLYSYYVVLSLFSVISYPLFEGNSIYAIRFLRMTIVPIVIIVTYLYSNGMLPAKQLKCILYVSMLFSLSTFARYIF